MLDSRECKTEYKIGTLGTAFPNVTAFTQVEASSSIFSTARESVDSERTPTPLLFSGAESDRVALLARSDTRYVIAHTYRWNNEPIPRDIS